MMDLRRRLARCAGMRWRGIRGRKVMHRGGCTKNQCQGIVSMTVRARILARDREPLNLTVSGFLFTTTTAELALEKLHLKNTSDRGNRGGDIPTSPSKDRNHCSKQNLPALSET